MNIKRYFRGVKFLFKSVFIEKPKGLDFSMRQKSIGIVTPGSHGYALTQEKSIDSIIKKLGVGKGDSFIDIGCGKGGVLRYVDKYCFERIAGLEIEDSLYKIAVKNFQKLKMPNIELFHDNALTFSRYGEFNVFFIANPFTVDMHKQLIDNIVESIKDSKKRIYLICYGGSIPEYIQSKNIFSKIEEYTDEVSGRKVCLWKSK